jgi:hypothetical protein
MIGFDLNQKRQELDLRFWPVLIEKSVYHYSEMVDCKNLIR